MGQKPHLRVRNERKSSTERTTVLVEVTSTSIQ